MGLTGERSTTATISCVEQVNLLKHDIPNRVDKMTTPGKRGHGACRGRSKKPTTGAVPATKRIHTQTYRGGDKTH